MAALIREDQSIPSIRSSRLGSHGHPLGLIGTLAPSGSLLYSLLHLLKIQITTPECGERCARTQSMERRHQVFVSSTYVDLIPERRELIQALLEIECLPAGMELFPAADESQWDLIKRTIDDSDYYVVVVGGRYGSIGSDGDSYTEMEYDYAVSTGMPVLGFIHGDPESLPRSKSEVDPDGYARLAAFRVKVKSRPVRFYTSPEDLGGQEP
jgi:hypothetical protein